MPQTFLKQFLFILLTLALTFSVSANEENVEQPVVEETAIKEEPKKGPLEQFNSKVGGVLFYDIAGGTITTDNVDRDGKLIDPKEPKKPISMAFIVVFLAIGAFFFTFFYRFINVRLFKHAIDVVRGKYDDPDHKGEISHFKALTSALSATIGLGNIAGVAFAIYQGGPGAVFWMMVIGFFGMCAKFNSATLAQYFRKENKDGSISGGPMYYLELGLQDKGPFLKALGTTLAVMYAFMVMGGSFGGGNMFQSNQSLAVVSNSLLKLGAITSETANSSSFKLTFGIIMAASVALVILGGIKRIGSATSKIVPGMCGLYVVASLYVIFSNFGELGNAISLIFTSAFDAHAFFGGVVGVMIIGIKRAAFSNEAGLGSASIVHAAAITDEPVREGTVAMIGPVIDTIIVCFMTAMVVIITGQWEVTAAGAGGVSPGAIMTMNAFDQSINGFSYVLTICILLFAYSTMISWCYYGERGWIYLIDKFFGESKGVATVIFFRIIFIIFVVLGAVNTSTSVLDFSDLMILSMAFPNILGSVFLAPFVWKKTKEYLEKYKEGKFKVYN
ncbi:MAG: alanine:cation symporter family protein [Lentisphaeraceae bacterium]|nr:alanine:cation symporter family protein [Lentisphaeraceae bacterium]